MFSPICLTRSLKWLRQAQNSNPNTRTENENPSIKSYKSTGNDSASFHRRDVQVWTPLVSSFLYQSALEETPDTHKCVLANAR